MKWENRISLILYCKAIIVYLWGHKRHLTTWWFLDNFRSHIFHVHRRFKIEKKIVSAMCYASNIKKCCTERKTGVELRIAEDQWRARFTESWQKAWQDCRKSLLHPISGILLPQLCWHASLWGRAACCVRGWSGLQRQFFVELNSDLDFKLYQLESLALSKESQIAVWLGLWGAIGNRLSCSLVPSLVQEQWCFGVFWLWNHVGICDWKCFWSECRVSRGFSDRLMTLQNRLS